VSFPPPTHTTHRRRHDRLAADRCPNLPQLQTGKLCRTAPSDVSPHPIDGCISPGDRGHGHVLPDLEGRWSCACSGVDFSSEKSQRFRAHQDALLYARARPRREATARHRAVSARYERAQCSAGTVTVLSLSVADQAVPRAGTLCEKSMESKWSDGLRHRDMFTAVMLAASIRTGFTPSSRSCEDGISRKLEAQCSRIVRKPPPAA
jgi:hypothetical protein